MLPPPIDQFSSYDKLLAHVRAFVLTQGYAVTIKRTRTDVNGEVKNVTLRCDRGGSYRNSLNLTDDLRHRQTASRLLDCPFELYGTRRNGVWFAILSIIMKHQRICLVIQSLTKEICAMISSECLKVQHVYCIALFEPLLGRVSVFALKKIHDEWIKASNATLDSPLDPCTGILSSTMGLPCSHLISERITNGQTLQQTDIHEHWWIQGRHFEFLGDLTHPVNGDCTNLQLLLQSFAQQYQFWPPHQQAAARTQLEELSSAPPDVLGNPEVSHEEDQLE